MSLLMDALRKAEEAKRQAGEIDKKEAAPARPAPSIKASELTLEPVGTPTAPSGGGLPNLSQHIDSVDADLAAVSTTAPTRKRQAPSAPVSGSTKADDKEAAERSAARNVFAAKQAAPSRTLLWWLLGIVGLCAAGIGGFFWWQLQSVANNSLAGRMPPAPATGAPAPQKATAPMATTQEQSPTATALNSLPPLQEKPQAQVAAALPEKKESPRMAASAVAGEESGRPIRLSANRLKSDPALNRAYEALQADNLSDARRDYEQVLRGDARNTDALLGLASIAARQGQADAAAALYLRVLEADPKDVNAKAGLINLNGQSDPALSESRLKTLLSSQPDSATLNFALGNLHARQGRWSDAQQAYFRAYTADPGNADYLFNLAVSLDHLRQKNLAVQYYQMALDAAGNRGVAFDRDQVNNRLLELQP